MGGNLMSDYDYNALLTPGVWRGNCGQREILERAREVSRKSKKLAKWISQSKHLIVFTGAGISTSAGIPDFRGPQGVWTLEEKGQVKDGKVINKGKPSVRFQDALPTITHMALVALEKNSLLKCIVSQNVDGLHMFSGIPREKLAELHGNIFMICCEKCGKELLLEAPVRSVGFKQLAVKCEHCKSVMRDCTLDWNDKLPDDDLALAKEHLKKADLCICLGSSLQVTPAANLPLKALKKYSKDGPGKLVIINLQRTPRDDFATMVIRYYVDDIFTSVMEHLNISIPEPQKIPLIELNKSFCKVRDVNWVETQLQHTEESESEEEEYESVDESIIPSKSDPEWTPDANNSKNTLKRKLPSRRNAQRKKYKQKN